MSETKFTRTKRGKVVTLTETSTKTGLCQLQNTREKHGFCNAWSQDEKILYVDQNDNNKMKVYDHKHLK